MHPEWHLLGEWNDSALALMGNAAIASKRYVSWPLMTAAILATKSRLAGLPTHPTDGGVAPTADAGAPSGGTVPAGDAGAGADGAGAAQPGAKDAGEPPSSEPPSIPPARNPMATRGGGCACTLADHPDRGTAALPALLALAMLQLGRRRRTEK